jgi:septal ring factor EnvC (AmiA/AmiB activator)
MISKVHPKYLAVLAATDGLIGWVVSVNWESVAQKLVFLATIGVGGFIAVRQMLRVDRRKWELENRDSLTAQIVDLRNKLHEAEQARSVVTGRLAQFQARIDRYQNQLSEASDDVAKLSRLLLQSNQNAIALADQLRKFQLATEAASERTTRAVADAAERVDTAVVKVAGIVQGRLDAQGAQIEKLNETSNPSIPTHGGAA